MVENYLIYNLIGVAVCKKVPNVLSRCYTKRRMGEKKKNSRNFPKIFKKVGVIPKEGWTGPSFFWYDNDSGHKGPFRAHRWVQIVSGCGRGK